MKNESQRQHGIYQSTFKFDSIRHIFWEKSKFFKHMDIKSQHDGIFLKRIVHECLDPDRFVIK